MNPRVQIVATIGFVFLAVLVLELVRKRKLREEYSLVWLFVIIWLGVLSFHRPLVEKFAAFIGIVYAPSALFVAAFAAGALLLLHLTVVISRLVERSKRLAQEIGLMELRLREIEQNLGCCESGDQTSFGSLEN